MKMTFNSEQWPSIPTGMRSNTGFLDYSRFPEHYYDACISSR
jgi:hypothetical protein